MFYKNIVKYNGLFQARINYVPVPPVGRGTNAAGAGAKPSSVVVTSAPGQRRAREMSERDMTAGALREEEAAANGALREEEAAANTCNNEENNVDQGVCTPEEKN